MAVGFKGGVVLGADSRTTTGLFTYVHYFHCITLYHYVTLCLFSLYITLHHYINSSKSFITTIGPLLPHSTYSTNTIHYLLTSPHITSYFHTHLTTLHLHSLTSHSLHLTLTPPHTHPLTSNNTNAHTRPHQHLPTITNTHQQSPTITNNHQ
jgi:hypothetical protein